MRRPRSLGRSALALAGIVAALSGCWVVLDIGDLTSEVAPPDAALDGDAVDVEVADSGEASPLPPVDAGPVPGLIAYFTFDETDGTTSADRTGHGYEANLVGGAAFAPDDGRSGGGVRLSGGSAYVEVPGLSGAAFPRNGTLAFWIKGDFGSATDKRIFDEPDDRRHVYLHAGAGSRLYALFFETDGGVLQKWESTTESDKWVHVFVGWGQRELFTKVAGAGYTGDLGSWQPYQQRFVLGGKTDAFQGVVDEVRLYDHALTDEEIARVP